MGFIYLQIYWSEKEIPQMEFKRIHFNVTVQHVNQYATATSITYKNVAVEHISYHDH